MPIININASFGFFDNLRFRAVTKFKRIFKSAECDPFEIPIILNNYNRLEYLQKMVAWLESAGYKNLFILDNNSTYPPLLDYYKSTPHTVYRLNKNVGFLALWQTIVFTRFSDNYYVYSDADLLPIHECPVTVLTHFKAVLAKFKAYDKVGFGLELNSIPDHYPLKENVISWEHKFWEHEIDKNIFEAPIDTTFALYRPGTKGGSELKALRTGYPYVAQHLSWYVDPQKLSADEVYYQRTTSASGSWTNKLTGNSTIPKY
ncbi:glycosyltransferase family protein [Pontibacter sp. CAU 1760]